MSEQTTPARDIFSVSRLNSEARAVLEGSFPLLWVEGEISNLSAPRSGHLYFSLKDAHAQVRCALFRGKRLLLRQPPANGDQVLVRARIGFYEPRGEFQLLIEHLEPAGAGSAQRRFEALKRKLQAEGLFDTSRKRELPRFPRRIGVITSPSGAAIRDVIKVLRRRAPHIGVIVYPSRVQGAGAAEELIDSLRVALARADCEVLLLTRGGGSIEDLAAFNDEALARRIAAAEIPIVSAVGHEIDFTIADFVADRRAPTPSAAAELISPDRSALSERIDAYAGRLTKALRRRTAGAQQRLSSLQGRLDRASPRASIRQAQQRLDLLENRAQRTLRHRLDQARQRLDGLSRRLQGQRIERRLRHDRQRFERLPERLLQAWTATQQRRRADLASTVRALHAVSPLATLQRGYAVLRSGERQRVIGSIRQTAPGEHITALLQDGTLDLTVTAVHDRPPGADES